MKGPIHIAIFGSGNGTNAQRIIEYFGSSTMIETTCVVYNKRDAFIAKRADKLGVEAHYFSKKDFYETDSVVRYLQEKQIDYIVLAGFLLLVPENLLSIYSGKIVNIHPALLPKYGGKGMYGEKVHESVIANHEKESGITIHEIDENYDRGTTLFQARCEVESNDTADSLAQKIHILEHTHFPCVIENWIKSKEGLK